MLQMRLINLIENVLRLMCAKLTLVTMLILTVTACSNRVELESATYEDSKKGQTELHVQIRSSELAKINRGQYYYSVVVQSCAGRNVEYPAQPFIDGVPASEFPSPDEASFSVISATIPTRILQQIREPCVRLRGGSYLAARLNSTEVPLKQKLD